MYSEISNSKDRHDLHYPTGGIKTILTGKNFVVAALAALSFVIVFHFINQRAINYLLTEKAQSTGMDWTHQIEAQIPMITDPAGRVSTPDTNQLSDLVASIFSVGNIYQIDIINPDCYCDVSFRSSHGVEPVKPADAEILPTDHDHHAGENVYHQNTKGHVHRARESAVIPTIVHSESTLEHIFNNRSAHHHARSPHGRTELYPVSRKVAAHIARTLNGDIYIHKSSSTDQPRHFAEVFHPVVQNEELKYIIRVLVDLEQENHIYTTVLYSGVGAVLLALILAIAYPTRKFLKSYNAQRAADARAHYLAGHDVMTGICNRNAFQEHMPGFLETCAEQDKKIIFVQFDSDNFKLINDTYGHAVGDKLLREFAQKLQSENSGCISAARLGGDEFIATFESVAESGAPPESGLEICSLFEVSVDHEGQKVVMTMSAGTAVYPDDGSTLKEIMRSCDLALYAAKEDKASYKPYDKAMGDKFLEQQQLREEFSLALVRNELEPHYQPLVNIKENKVEGFEALIRWNHPTRGLLTPFAFEELLTDPEFSTAITFTMLRKIIADIQGWKRDGIPFVCIGLNIGENDLSNVRFSKTIINALVNADISPNELAIEITETCMFGDRKSAFIRQLEDLKSAGCKIALDDFGTGFSSITQIKELPFSALKIDKSFVRGIIQNPADQAIVSALVSLSERLKFRIVCEGVETAEQLDFLEKMGCDLAQGFLFSRPVPASCVPQLTEEISSTRFKPDCTEEAA